jgi:putative transposase
MRELRAHMSPQEYPPFVRDVATFLHATGTRRGLPSFVQAAEPPPARWSILRYGFGHRWRTVMPRKRHKPEEIVAKLRQVDVLVSQGQSVADAVRSIGVTEVTYYRWRQEFGGLKADQVRRLKELETENARLRRAVADLTLDKLILREAASGNC